MAASHGSRKSTLRLNRLPFNLINTLRHDRDPSVFLATLAATLNADNLRVIRKQLGELLERHALCLGEPLPDDADGADVTVGLDCSEVARGVDLVTVIQTSLTITSVPFEVKDPIFLLPDV